MVKNLFSLFIEKISEVASSSEFIVEKVKTYNSYSYNEKNLDRIILDNSTQEVVCNNIVINIGSVQPVQPRLDSDVFLEPEIVNSFYYFDGNINGTGEILPWGVKAVWQGEDITVRGNFASDTYAFVIDSGVLDTTGDINLSSNITWHRSWVFNETPFMDGTGHGTHVAGTIGALVNGKGIVGVAPGAQIVSLKVFDSRGGGTAHTTIIEAINYAASIINGNNLDKNKCVINLSLSGIFNPSLEAAIKSIADQGIRFSIAAGNNGRDADGYTPASAGDHQNVYTVSASDNNYTMPFWSNWDLPDVANIVDDVDFAAPGVGVLSYHRNGQLAYLSGTSMAAPHLAGLLLTGGVQAGTSVTGNGSDPFAITSTQTFIPLPPRPTYTLTSNTTVNEGQTLKIDLATTNVSQGTSLYWRVSGGGINLNDFIGLPALDGVLATGADGSASINFNINQDTTTERNEVLRFELFGDPARTNKITERSITIQDTSVTPPPPPPVVIPGLTLWGTIGNDTLIGGAGRDTLTGVLPIGTTQASLGVGQIDVLTGGSGADIFVLGDSRGVFYDDGIINNLGTSDYALITDFKLGEDKLQLKKGESYIFEIVGNDLFFYSDRNRNRSLQNTGPNQDELIAILQGVPTIGNNDLIVI